MAAAEVWRRLPAAVLDAGSAIARAVALLEGMPAAGPPALAWTRVRAPALILGRSAADPAVDWRLCAEAGITVHRRASGGGPLLWDHGLLALDVALPPGHALASADVVEAYRWLGEAMAGALHALGAVDARALTPRQARAAPPGDAAAACFGGTSAYEVVTAERKVVGLAQVRRRSGTLLQAGVALRLDAATLAAALGRDRRFASALADRAAGLAEVGAVAEPGAVVAAVEAAVCRRAGVGLSDDALSAGEERRAAELATEAHGDLRASTGAPAAGRPPQA